MMELAGEKSTLFTKGQRCNLRNNIISLWRKVEAGQVTNWNVRASCRGDSSMNEVELYSLTSPDRLKIVLGLELQLTESEFSKPSLSSGVYERRTTYRIDTSDPGPDGRKAITQSAAIYYQDEKVRSEPDRDIGYKQYVRLGLYLASVLASNPSLRHNIELVMPGESPFDDLAELPVTPAVASQTQ